MLHHSNSRNQRNRGSRIKTLLQATLLLGVVLWLLYQVKHSYDKKNVYLDDTEDHLARNDRSIFQGRKEKAGSYKEKAGSYSDSNVEMVAENSDAISKPGEGAVDHHSDAFDHNEEKSGETVFEKDSTNLHEDDKRNTEMSGAEEGQVNSADGTNTEVHSNNSEDEKTAHSEEDKHDAESNSGADSKSEVHSTGDDMPQNNHAQDENTGVRSGASHDEGVQGDESTNADQINASSNGSDGEAGEKKEAMDTQTASESLPDETGNIPSFHTDNSQNDASENQGDAASATSDSSEHTTRDAVHIETGLGDEGATASSGTASGDKGYSADLSDSTSAEERTETASGGDEKGTESGISSEVSYSKRENSEKGNAGTEATKDHAANTEANSQGDSSVDVVTGSSEETKPVEYQRDGATETTNNGEQVDTKIETITSTNDENSEPQGGDGSSGSNDSNSSGPEQTSKTQTQ